MRIILFYSFILLSIHNLSAQFWDQQRFSSEIRVSGSNFGESIYLDKDYTIISAPGGGTSNDKIESVFIYDNASDSLEFLFEIRFEETVESVEGNSRFGANVERSGDYIFIGLSNFDYNGVVNSGALYVYKKELDENIWNLYQEIYPPQPETDLYFGGRFEANNDFLAVGVPNKDGGNNTFDNGAAYIYALNENDNWELEQSLFPSNSQDNMQFGASLSFYNKRVAIGAPNSSINGLSFMGNVFLFERQLNLQNDFEWNEIEVFNGPVIGASNRGFNFGISIHLDENRLIVGAPAESTTNSSLDYQGKTYIIEYDELSQIWNLEHVLNASDGFKGNKFGYKIAYDNNYLLIKGNNETDEIHSGKVYLYKFIGDEWVEQKQFIPNNLNSYNGFGFDFDIKNESIIIGDSWDEYDNNNENFLPNSGTVYIIEKSAITSENTSENPIVRIYPNPSTDFLYLTPSSSVDFKYYRIYNTQGKQLSNEIFEGNQIDIRNLNSGSYIIEFYNQTNKAVIQFIKSN